MTNAHHEIERVWVLREAPAIPAGAEVWEIEQGYLPQPSVRDDLQRAGYPEGRLRRVTLAHGEQRFFHTRKTGSGLVRVEHEREIDCKEFDELWPGTVGKRITKTRHRVHEAGLVWEVDVFRDVRVDERALVMVEVELEREDQAATLPSWIAPLVVKEVTTAAHYRNSALAH